jgi:tRNA G10  N-methylase Trm11
LAKKPATILKRLKNIFFMKYAFILGRVYTLSLAELIEYFVNNSIEYKILACAPEVVVVETSTELDAQKLQDRSGGLIKIIKIVEVVQKKGKEFPSQVLENLFTYKRIKSDYFNEYTGKQQFGVSIHSLEANVRFRDETQRIAFFIKKVLQDEAVSVRAVLPVFPAQALSSVQVTENQILAKGAEIVIISGAQRLFVGKTLSVQNYEDYGRRDYQRPARDERSGMIPPKVAQIMINLAGKIPSQGNIFDPFCGSGTILQEALLLGYKAIGSDIEKKAIENSEINLEWFKNRYRLPPGRYKLFQSHAAELAINMPKASIEAIVSEGTLGPIYVKIPKKSEINANFKQISKLYEQVFAEFAKILPKKVRIVMCLPAYRMERDQYEFMPSLDFALKNGYSIRDSLPVEVASKYKFLKVTDRKSIVYDRKDQIVAREIIIFQQPVENHQPENILEEPSDSSIK